ncbi:hypothetical protein ACFOD1_03490 [Pseudidiomarina halophila]|uniref:Uncharacterized protein n=1 Tax=Pseudidiomarina halophila TaxID=1449799 RepID=A0A432XZK9_9GAMM|nr:hypothetical protein [Pseudidiomarina halophila]RUO54011.1 hypothetical protein CWI69_00840 [Pseudidiomarina halophila]
MNTSIINRSEINYEWSQTLTKRSGQETKVRTAPLISNCGLTADWVTDMTDDLFPSLSNRASKPTRQAMQAALLNIANGVSERAVHGQPSGFLCELSNTSKKVPKRYRDHDYSSNTMGAVLSALEAEGFLECHKGYRTKGYSSGLSTLWLPTHSAKQFLSALNEMLVIEFFRQDTETLWLKSRNGGLLDYKDDMLTNDMRLLLRNTNDLRACVNWYYRPQGAASDVPGLHIGEALIPIGKRDLTFKRQFNETFNKGGRFYGNVQQLSKQERATITMNGEPTTELDIKSLHPRMLYNMKGIAAPFDCYDIDGYDRETMKTVGLIALNAKSELSAVRALANSLSTTHEYARRAIEAFRLKHQPIAEFLFSSSWSMLQYQDSELAKDILSEAADEGIPVIPVHDSFISSTSHAQKLSGIIHKQYEKRFGFLPVVEPTLRPVCQSSAA